MLEAIQSVIVAFSHVIMRFESGRPDRCPRCNSCQVRYGYIPDVEEYTLHCEKYGWNNMDGRWKAVDLGVHGGSPDIDDLPTRL